MSYKFARGDLAPAIKVAFQHGGCASISGDMQLTRLRGETFYLPNVPMPGLACQGERNRSCTDHGRPCERSKRARKFGSLTTYTLLTDICYVSSFHAAMREHFAGFLFGTSSLEEL
jgi:hypothetical protein